MKKMKMIVLALLICSFLIPCAALGEELTSAGVDKSLYPWGPFLADTDVVSSNNNKETYSQYLELFDEYTYANPNQEIGDMTYYMYDPVAHGADPEKAYPVVLWFHGRGNSAQGKTAIMLMGAAAYATADFQAVTGEMYIICPYCNETNEAHGAWGADYNESIKGIYDAESENHNFNGELLVAGQSMGGRQVNAWLEEYADITNVIMWINTYLPTPERVRELSTQGLVMWAENGIYDEMIPFDVVYPDGPSAYDGIENFHKTILTWIRNGDKSISTINYGPTPASEMGQHCSCLQYNRNLIFDDGTPDDIYLPEGVTGWIRDAWVIVRGK